MGEAAVIDITKGALQPDILTVVPMASHSINTLILPATTMTVTVVAPAVSPDMEIMAHADSVKPITPKKHSTPAPTLPNVILL